MGGLVLGRVFIQRTSTPASPALTVESSAEVSAPASTLIQVPSVSSVHAPVSVRPQLAEAPGTAPTVPVALVAVQSLNSFLTVESVKPVALVAPVTSTPLIIASASSIADRTATINSTGFAPLALPALSVEAEDAVSLSTFPLPAVLAAAHTAVPLDPEQKAGLEAIADDFAEKAGEPPADNSEPARPAFAVNAYIAATEADFLIKQRYGHRAYIQMQMEAYRASFARQ